MKYFRKVALAWARFQYRISKPWRLAGLMIIGLFILGDGIFRYMQTGNSVELYTALVGLIVAMLALERAGFMFWIEGLQQKAAREESSETPATQTAHPTTL